MARKATKAKPARGRAKTVQTGRRPNVAFGDAEIATVREVLTKGGSYADAAAAANAAHHEGSELRTRVAIERLAVAGKVPRSRRGRRYDGPLGIGTPAAPPTPAQAPSPAEGPASRAGAWVVSRIDVASAEGPRRAPHLTKIIIRRDDGAELHVETGRDFLGIVSGVLALVDLPDIVE